MAIKIDNGIPSRGVVSDQNSKVKAKHGDTASHAQSSRNENSAERVSITKVSIDLKNALESFSEIPVVDTMRVEQLKSDIQKNVYKIDFARVAQNMIKFERLLQGND